MPTVSIVITNYNGKHFLGACLSSVLQTNYPRNRYEVILVDNASTDGSVEYVRSKFPFVKVLPLSENYGFTGGNNLGVRVAQGDFIVFLNNDTIVDREWLSELVKVTLSHPRIGICGSKIISMKDRKTITYNGRALHILGGVIPHKFLTFEDGCGKKICVTGCVQGSSFLVRKDVFEVLGGFDNDYFLYSDEVDICYRAWINGYYVGYAPNSIVYHYGGGTAGTLDKPEFGILYERLKSPLRIYYGNRNSIINIIKNLELKNILIGMVFSSMFFFLQLFVLLKNNDAKNIRLLTSAYIQPIKNLKSIWMKRAAIQASRKLIDKELIKKGVFLPINTLLKFATTEIFS